MCPPFATAASSALSFSKYGSAARLSLPAPASHFLKVPFGQITFDAEGREDSSRYFSRKIHWPGGNSGVTIGRGFDMRERSAQEVFDTLLGAGVPALDAHFLALGAGLRGAAARSFVERHGEDAPVISLEAQQQLFNDALVPFYIDDIKRIFSKPDVVEQYGEADWDSLSPLAQSLLFDLRYRGDYTPGTRERIQGHLVHGDEEGFFSVIRDEMYWQERGVPSGRIAARIAATWK